MFEFNELQKMGQNPVSADSKGVRLPCKSFAAYEFGRLPWNGAIGSGAEGKFATTDGQGFTRMGRAEGEGPEKTRSRCCIEFTRHATTEVG